MNTSVYQRGWADSIGRQISASQFHLTIGGVLLWGFAVNFLIVRHVPLQTLLSIRPLGFFLVYFALCLSGMWLVHAARSAVAAFLGYNLIVVPLGCCVLLAIAQVEAVNPKHAAEIVSQAVFYTGSVTACMMVLGAAFPGFFRGIARMLFFSLIGVIAVVCIAMLLGRPAPAFLDWIILLTFCGYIGLDWGRADRVPRTTHNAISVAASIYIDVINLFLTILRILSNRRD